MYEVTLMVDGRLSRITIQSSNIVEVQRIVENMYSNTRVQILNIRGV